jgi:predicted DNA-binding transcriptional regulator AlpA
VAAVDTLLRVADVAMHLGISRRTFERERAAGRFPLPDLKIGKAPLWRPGTVQGWIESHTRTANAGGVGR